MWNITSEEIYREEYLLQEAMKELREEEEWEAFLQEIEETTQTEEFGEFMDWATK